MQNFIVSHLQSNFHHFLSVFASWWFCDGIFSAACFSHWLLDSTTSNNWQNKPRSSWEENISGKQLSFVELERDKALVEFTHSSLDNLLEGGILCAAHLNGWMVAWFSREWIDISYLQTSQVNDCLPRVNRDCDSITGEDFRHRFLPKHVLECRTWKLLKRENSYLEKFNETLLEMQLVSFGGRWKVFRTVQAFRLNFESNSGIDITSQTLLAKLRRERHLQTYHCRERQSTRE